MLAEERVRRCRAEIAAVLTQVRQRPALRVSADRLGHACAVLDEVERDDPALVRGRDGLLLHPFVGAWAGDLLHRLGPAQESAENERQIEARVGYLIAGVAAVAVGAGRTVTLEVAVPAAGLPVPGAGRFLLGEREYLVGARLTTGAGELALYADDGQRARWQPNRLLPGVGSGRLVLDDTDPYRDVFGPVAPRLSAGAVIAWSTALGAAGPMIEDEYPEYLAGLEAGLRVIVPLPGEAVGGPPVFGAFGCAPPPTPAGLARLMLRAGQQVKLAALIDLVPLFEPDDPVGVLLRAAYAQLAETDFWHRQRAHPTVDPVGTDRQFSRCRAQTGAAIEELLAAPGLNDQGRRFVAGLAIGLGRSEPTQQVDLSAAEAMPVRPGGTASGPSGRRRSD